MKTVLVIGAGGVFGSRLAAGLARDGFAVICAGRRIEAAQAAAAALQAKYPGATVGAAALDTHSLDAAALRATGADIVVDAAGPFQGAEPLVARAAIEARLPYVDLADGRDFVAGFDALDAAARKARVPALTGCSSTPALSNAVLDALTEGWREVVSVEVGISPGARAPRGLAVTEAILSWAGRPVRVFEDGSWRERNGWSGLTRRRFGKAGGRWLSLCETPDLDILPARFRPRESAVFMAGLTPGLLHFGMGALSALSGRVGVDLKPRAGLLNRLSKWIAVVGSDRGAMRVAALGVDGRGRAVRARWLLVAEPGEGPVAPSLPALAAVKAIAAGRIAPGARPCVGELALSEIEAEIARHRITVSRWTERAAVFARALGADFDALPSPLRALHETPGRSLWRGMARVDGPEGPLAAVVGQVIGFPGRDGEAPVQVSIDADGGRSIWRRRIGPARFTSILSRPKGEGRISERFGLITVALRLAVESERLVYRVEGWRLGPIPLPRALAPRTRTHEAVDAEGRFTFDVEISMPIAGRIVRYRGWLVRQ